MEQDQNTAFALAKIALAWIGAMFGSLTLSNVALVLTIVFTALQIYKLVRDLWPRRGDRP